MTAGAYAPSPRPTFAGPARIPYDAVTRHLWGDAVSGEVADWIYVSSERIHQLVFGLPPGGAFRHSEEYRTVFAADEVLYVLGGTMVIANPETGEVYRVPAGEAVLFGPNTWHHAFSYGMEPLRVLEYFAPPPSQGTAGTYARTRPNLMQVAYRQDRWLGRWPASRDERREGTMRVVRADDVLWRLEGTDQAMLVGLLASTEHLTVGTIHLLPGRHGGVEVHDGDEGLYLLRGSLHVRLPEHDGPRWLELEPGDGCYIPAGVPHQYYNISGAPAECLFGVAPRYARAGATER
jgi:mannose-6-phosphate isomerase-like protein (cupin superfamily)